MKKYLLGLLAIILAVSFSAFTNVKAKSSKLTSYKWFQISGTYSPTSAVLQVDASYLGEGEIPPSGSGCSGSTNQCVSGFNSTQVDQSNQLIDDNQTPAVTPNKKS